MGTECVQPGAQHRPPLTYGALGTGAVADLLAIAVAVAPVT